MATTAQPLPGTGVADVGHPAPPTPEGAAIRNLRTIGMVWKREIIRFRRTPARIVSGLAQPILFLFVLGAGIKPLVGQNSAGGVDYQQFILPGVMAMSVLFSSLFSAISIVWDREFGFLREMLVASGLSARIDHSRVPVIDGVRDLLRAGMVAGGTQRNHAFVDPDVDWGGISGDEQLLLADAQTSGGLLLAVEPARAGALVAALGRHGTPAAAVVGHTVEGAPGRIGIR